MATIHWKSGVSGDWSTAADWDSGTVPAARDAVVIDAAGAFTVSIDHPAAAGSLLIDSASATVVDTGSLRIGTDLTVEAGVFDLERGGLIHGGTLAAAGGQFVFNGGILAAVTFQGAITDGAGLTIAGGLGMTGAGGVGPGTIEVGAQASLVARDSETISGAAIQLGQGATIRQIDTDRTGVTLTLSADTSVTAASFGSGLYAGPYAGDAIVNDGTIATSSDDFTIAAPTFVNEGLLSASGGDLVFRYGLTSAQLGRLQESGGGGAVFQGAGLDNAGATLGAAGGLTLGGTIVSGTLAGTINVAGYGGAFHSGLTLAANVRLSGVGGTGPASIVLGGYGDVLSGLGTETIDNAAIDLAALQTFVTQSGSGTLTLGSSLTIEETAVFNPFFRNVVGIDAGSAAGDELINRGVVQAAANFGDFYIGGQTFINAGTIDVAGFHGELEVGAAEFENLGAINSDGSLLIFGKPLSTRQLGDVTGSGALFFDLLQNVGATLDATSGLTLGGTINGGTIAGDVVVAAGYQSAGALTLTGGVRLLGAGGAGQGRIDVEAYAGKYRLYSESLYIQSGRTIDNVEIVLQGEGYSRYQTAAAYLRQSDAGTNSKRLTMGANVVIDQTRGPAGIATGGSAGDVIVNRGVIDTSSGFTLAGETFVNQGLISIGLGPFTVATRTFLNEGRLDLDTHVSLTFDARVARAVNLGAISLDGGMLRGGSLVETAASTLVGSGQVSTRIYDDGLIEASSGTLIFTQEVSGVGGALRIDSGATLELDSLVTADLSVDFAGAGATLKLGEPAQIHATIAGFTSGETIDLLRTAATGASLDGSDRLVIVNGATRVAILQLSGNYAGQSFAVAADGHGGSAITVTGGGAPASFPRPWRASHHRRPAPPLQFPNRLRRAARLCCWRADPERKSVAREPAG